MSGSHRDVVLLGAGHTHAHVLHEWRARPIPDARLICINTPLNPTGTVMSRAEVEAIARLVVDENARFLIEELIPKVNKDFRTLTGPENTSTIGSSMGGWLAQCAENSNISLLVWTDHQKGQYTGRIRYELRAGATPAGIELSSVEALCGCFARVLVESGRLERNAAYQMVAATWADR